MRAIVMVLPAACFARTGHFLRKGPTKKTCHSATLCGLIFTESIAAGAAATPQCQADGVKRVSALCCFQIEKRDASNEVTSLLTQLESVMRQDRAV